MKNAALKLASRNLFREENQPLVELALLFTLLICVVGICGVGIVSRVDSTFSQLGARLISYIH